MKKLAIVAALGALLTAGAAVAGKAKGKGKRGGGGKGQKIMKALDLPIQAQKLRDNGMSAKEVQVAIAAAKHQGMSAAEARDMMVAVNQAYDLKNTDNLGDLIAKLIASGKRGNALTQAIKGGKGKGGKGKGKGGKGKGKKKGKE